ncbi:MAG: hypothetical protein II939_13795 [Bacteroidales bacterium]|nr:hypothetical protein [Bacteroidales bacterium]
MKKLIPIIAAVALMACNGANQNQTSQNADSSIPVETCHGASLPTPTPHQPVFVLSDQLGTKFLLQSQFQDGANPTADDSLKSYKYAIYGGKTFPVSFNGVQLENKEKNTSRDTYRNFDNLPGWIYSMNNGKLLENPKDEWDGIWDAPLLVDSFFVAENQILPFQEKSVVTPAMKTALENKFSRKIQALPSSLSFGNNGEYQMVNVQFKNKGTDALGVSALFLNGEILAVKEFPAQWNEESVWRVDDMGEFGGLYVDLATVNNNVLTIYTADSGAEGCNYDQYIIKDGAFFQGTINASFYQAPE